MAETAFILGAGAPLMRGFLGQTKKVIDQSRDSDLARDLAVVTKARLGFEAAVACVQSHLENIEELLGLFEMGDTVASVSGVEEGERGRNSLWP